jgi:alkylated DNA nucleotide flippase Atl1
MKRQKEEIIGYVRGSRREGRTVTEILKRLEVPRSSYYRWIKAEGRKVARRDNAEVNTVRKNGNR